MNQLVNWLLPGAAMPPGVGCIAGEAAISNCYLSSRGQTEEAVGKQLFFQQAAGKKGGVSFG
ncbi:MAG: hypothetical protein ACOX0T_09400 [Pelotomaculum sp.]